MDKSRKKIAQDYSRNAIADSKSSKKSIKKDGKYEAKMAVKEAAGEGPSMYGKSKGPKMGAGLKKPTLKKMEKDGKLKEGKKGDSKRVFGKNKGPKMGAKKGDQSKSRADYAMDSGKTDKGYKGKDGSSKGDQSASKRDYMGKGPKMYDKGPKMESMSQEKSNLMNDMPIDSRASSGSPAMNLNKGYGKPMASPMKMAGSWMSKHTKSKM